MRTHIQVLTMLLVATAAWGEQPFHPATPCPPPAREHISGHTDLPTLRATVELRAQEARQQWVQSVLPRSGDPGFQASSPISASFSSISRGARPDPLALPTSNQRSTAVARFDTVYQTRGGYQDRIHIFTYEQGRLINRRTLVHIDDNWLIDEDYSCTYTPSGSLASRTTFSTLYPGSWYTQTFSYDLEGREISEHDEYYTNMSGVPTSAWFDTVAFDLNGEVLYRRYESWRDGGLTWGVELEVTPTDTATVMTQSIWHRGEWILDSRGFESNRPGDHRYVFRYQTWNGAAWTDAELTSRTLDDEGQPIRSETFRWGNGEWAPEYRTTYTYGPSNPSRTEYTERRAGLQWEPAWLWYSGVDAAGRTVICSSSHWNYGWVPDFKSTVDPGADGSVNQADSNWTEGRLTFASRQWRDASGNPLLFEDLWWDTTGNVTGSNAQMATYTPGGQESEVIRSTWSDGAWHPETRYVFSYDEADRLRSLKLFIRDHDTWIAPPGPPSVGEYPSWTSYWVFSDTDEPAMRFWDFDELTFAYQRDVSDVGPFTNLKPGRSLLQPNFPNPFNPATTIPFSVATGAHTTIAVFDVLGREVARPVDQWRDPGEYRVQFDAAGLASGMYICRFTAGSVTQTRKLMLVR